MWPVTSFCPHGSYGLINVACIPVQLPSSKSDVHKLLRTASLQPALHDALFQQHPLIITASAAVPADNGTCKWMHPLVYPNEGGSTLFVYHQTAVQEFRDYAVRAGQFAPTGKRAKMIKLWNEIAGMQLGATLTYLGPANDVGLFAVTLKTDGGMGGRRMLK
jgi:hypothetical protein